MDMLSSVLNKCGACCQYIGTTQPHGDLPSASVHFVTARISIRESTEVFHALPVSRDQQPRCFPPRCPKQLSPVALGVEREQTARKQLNNDVLQLHFA